MEGYELLEPKAVEALDSMERRIESLEKRCDDLSAFVDFFRDDIETLKKMAGVMKRTAVPRE